jgi:hypothetical protein
MIADEKIEELLKLPAEERRRVIRLLQQSLRENDEAVVPCTSGDQTSPAAKWLLSMAGRYSLEPGNTESTRESSSSTVLRQSCVERSLTKKQ